METEQNKTDLKFWAALSHFPKFGPIRFKKIIKHFSGMESAFYATRDSLVAAGIEEKIAEEFVSARHSLNPDEIMDRLNREQIGILTIKDGDYPPLLKEIYDPPAVLYFKGAPVKNYESNLAVVGARKHTAYGQIVTEKIIGDLARAGVLIVSGLAIGIDSLSHKAALDNGGNTVAVLGSGLDRQNIYPSSNRWLADKIIASGGTLFSEFIPGTPPLRHHFPQRNRIISGLSKGVLVIEASEKSGSLITAKFALDQNRDIYAIPGNIYGATAYGTNKLIKMGATAVTSAEDIIEAFNLEQVTSQIADRKTQSHNQEEARIIAHLASDPVHINDLIRLTKLDTNIINSTLTILEINGVIKNIGNMQYILAPTR